MNRRGNVRDDRLMDEFDDDFLPPDYDNDADDYPDDDGPTFLPPSNQSSIRHFRQIRLASSNDNLVEAGTSRPAPVRVDISQPDTNYLPSTSYESCDDALTYQNRAFRDDEEEDADADDERDAHTQISRVVSEREVIPRGVHRNIVDDDVRSGSQNSDETNESVKVINNREPSLPTSFRNLCKGSGKEQRHHVDPNINPTEPQELDDSHVITTMGDIKGKPKKIDRKVRSKLIIDEVPLQELGYENKAVDADADADPPPFSPPPQIIVEAVQQFQSVRPTGANNIKTTPPKAEEDLTIIPQAKPMEAKGKPQQLKRKKSPRQARAGPTLDELMEEGGEELEEDFGNLLQSRRKRSFRGRRKSSKGLKPPTDNGHLLPDSPGARSNKSFKQMYQEGHQTEERLLENLRIQKEIIEKIRNEPWRMKKKLKTVRLAKAYIEKFEGKLSKSQGYQEVGAKYWRRFKREFSNFTSVFIPWEMRIKKIESHFGSVVSSYFTFLRWLLGVNILLTMITMGFIVIPEVLVGPPFGSSPSKSIPEDEKESALKLKSILDFEGYLKYSPIFYGYYGAEEKIGSGYRLPIAYFVAGLATYALSFVILLRRMAKNSRASKMSSKDEQYSFSWKVFTTWDFMIGIQETAKNKSAEISTNFREAILEVKEKERGENKKLLIFLRVVANILVMGVLAGSAYAIQICVRRSDEFEEIKKNGGTISAWESMEISIVMTLITSLFPSIFDLIGLMEKYHPRVNLRWQLARILTLYFLNLYTLVYALWGKIGIQQLRLKEKNEILLNATIACNATQIRVPVDPVTMEFFNSTQSITTISPLTTEIYNCSKPAELNEIICWENMIGQEMFKLAFTDTWMTCLIIIAIDCIRGLFVRYMNPCWCWDLERKFPEYGEFHIAENILHLVYNQATIWLGTFFVPVLPGFNIVKLVILLYVRSWAVLVCNIPHERVFKASGSNNFYYAISLLMLFLVTLAVAFLLVVESPSNDCGPFRNYSEGRSYHVLTDAIENDFPDWANTIMSYIASPGIIIPVFLLLCMAIYYLSSLSRTMKESNKDLKDQLLFERTEGKKKIYAMADGRKEENGKGPVESQKLDQGAPRNGKENANGPVGQAGASATGVDHQTARPVNHRPNHVVLSGPPRRGVRVVKVPGMTMQQAAALKARNPNVRIMTAAEAARLRILPAPGGRGRGRGMGAQHHSGVRRARPLLSPHSIPPVAVVQGKPSPNKK